jgi:hypothetical protein
VTCKGFEFDGYASVHYLPGGVDQTIAPHNVHLIGKQSQKVPHTMCTLLGSKARKCPRNVRGSPPRATDATRPLPVSPKLFKSAMNLACSIYMIVSSW